MFWNDEGYLLSKRNLDENSIIVDVFTLKHGKCSGIVYGGSSSKKKNLFQIGNKLYLTFKSKNENRIGYFNVELIKAITPLFFDNKKKSISILSAASILKILLPENQINEKIYKSFDKLLECLNQNDWIKLYIFWELSLIKELGFEINTSIKKKNLNKETNYIEINDKLYKIPEIILNQKINNISNPDIVNALTFNKNVIYEHFIIPNKLKFPLSRNILQKYFI
jgi:DNA repair protein RecO (recombination protein O)